MLKSKKKVVIDQVKSIYHDYDSFIVVHYHGLKTADLSSLRYSLREISANFKIVKNSLSTIASLDSSVKPIGSMLKGPVGIAYSHDPISLSKKIVSFAKEKEDFKVIGGVIDQEAYDADQILNLSKLPSLDDIRRDIVSTISFIPSGIVRVLQDPSTMIVRSLEVYASGNNS